MNNWTKKQWLMLIPKFIGWLIYRQATHEERTKYYFGKSLGMECVEYKHGYFSYFSELKFSKDRKPEREFMYWREYWEYKGYLK